ncbi:histone deacetylase [Conexibacter sp. DBS9H8]|uniref:histone deacetylase family protein n=1 Tax=Conexibacter sp. DBS9H8 TaxID=2937801 RepID=UPI00200EB43E|nr:histone deacetylase [Conexibacter sp. DBS9H8]
MSLYLSHPASLDHDTGAHPECADRIVAIEAHLAARNWLGWERALAPAASDDQLALVHPLEHIAAIAAAAAAAGEGRVALDADTVLSAGSERAARHAAGGAIALVDGLLGGGHRVGVSAHRPPGHHACADRAMGFCLFNNVAIAARHALSTHGLSRVAIVDWDVHHGNGTQEIFWTSAEVLFCSIHQMPLYPGSGRREEIGVGPGAGLTVNLPVPPGAGDEIFLSRLVGEVSERVVAFAPELLLVSAGFDAHADDPLAACEVTDDGFHGLGARVGALADGLGIPLGVCLEGGYDTGALARSLVAVMEALTAA